VLSDSATEGESGSGFLTALIVIYSYRMNGRLFCSLSAFLVDIATTCQSDSADFLPPSSSFPHPRLFTSSSVSAAAERWSVGLWVRTFSPRCGVISTNFSGYSTPDRRLCQAADLLPVPHYKIAPRKVSPGRQFTGKNPPRPMAARAGRIFTGKLSAGRLLAGAEGDPITGRLLWGRRYFNEEETQFLYQFRN